MKLYNRNDIKNPKVLLYLILSVLFITAAGISVILSALSPYALIGAAAAYLLHVLFFFLLRLKINDYKLKYYLDRKGRKKFIEESLRALNLDKSKAAYKAAYASLKDNYYRTGGFEPICYSEWNAWLGKQLDFNCEGADFGEKLSYICYNLYNAAASGDGLEGFFRDTSRLPFSAAEIEETLFRDKFFSDGFAAFFTGILREYDVRREDELFARYESLDNKTLFSYEAEIENCAVWLSRNEKLLSHTEAEQTDVARIYLSRDYREMFRVTLDELGSYRYERLKWHDCGIDESYWEQCYISGRFADENLLTNDLADKISDFIKI